MRGPTWYILSPNHPRPPASCKCTAVMQSAATYSFSRKYHDQGKDCNVSQEREGVMAGACKI